jgi:hypothetical protein
MAPSAESFSRHLLYLTEEPHQTGTPRNMELADYVRDRFVEYGLADAVPALRIGANLNIPMMRMISKFTLDYRQLEDRNRSAVRHHLEGRQRAIRRVPNLRTIGQHLP